MTPQAARTEKRKPDTQAAAQQTTQLAGAKLLTVFALQSDHRKWRSKRRNNQRQLCKTSENQSERVWCKRCSRAGES